jgi:hypothetical protein
MISLEEQGEVLRRVRIDDTHDRPILAATIRTIDKLAEIRHKLETGKMNPDQLSEEFVTLLGFRRS